MNFFNREEKSKSIGYKVILENLTEKEWEQLVRRKMVNLDTKVSQEGYKNGWITVGNIPQLSIYFRRNIADSLNSFSDAIKSVFNEVENFFQTIVGEKLIIPKQLYQTLEDYLNEGTDEVALTIGKDNDGQPIFIVLLLSKDQPPILKNQIPIDIDTSQWSSQSIRNWPETGSKKAKIWNIKQYN